MDYFARMAAWVKRLESLILPDLPPEIAEEFVVHAAAELQRQAPWLLATMFINSVIAILTASPAASWFVAYGLPGIMAVYCVLTTFALRRDMRFAQKPRRASRFLVQSAISSSFGGLVCSTWCVLSWLSAPVEARMHFPIILVVGALATAYCLTNIKSGAVATLLIDMIPISALMMLSGHPVEFAAAASLLLAGLFKLRMIDVHHARVVELLRLQHAAHRQARTDTLTGLANRRALLDAAGAIGGGGAPLRLVLVDIDHFKAINDGHGHDMGDEVLCAVARLLRRHHGGRTVVARIGGEEFAVIGPVGEIPAGLPLAILADIRMHAMPHGQPVTASVGVAQGPASEEGDWRTLFARADAALYEAKAAGRNRMAEAAAPATRRDRATAA